MAVHNVEQFDTNTTFQLRLLSVQDILPASTDTNKTPDAFYFGHKSPKRTAELEFETAEGSGKLLPATNRV